MLLAFAIDYISRPIVDTEADDYADYWIPAWLEAQLQNAQTPDFSDIEIYHLQDGIIASDTSIFCEYYDEFSNEYKTGVIEDWRTDTYIGEQDIERAIIRTASGSCDYVLEQDILPIHEIIEVNNEPLSEMLPALADTSNADATPRPASVPELRTHYVAASVA